MKKKLLLLALPLLLTGCTVNYNLNITQSFFNENISINIKKPFDNDALNLLKNTKNTVFEKEDVFYTSKYKETDDSFKIDYKYSYNSDEFKKAKILNWCYDNRKIVINQNKISITTEGEFKCFNHYGKVQMDSAKINITTNELVVDSNADVIKDNTYTWIINKENYNNKPIHIEIERSSANKSLANNAREMTTYISIILVLLIIILINVVIKKTKNNSL